MMLVNLTPHPVVLAPEGAERIIIPPSGAVARVASVQGRMIDAGLPIPVLAAPAWGAIEGLPDPVPGTVYIVSALVLARTDRPDVVAPGTGPQDGAIRNAAGQIEAVRRFICAAA